MNYIKTTVIIPFNKSKLTIKQKEKIKELRDFLYSLGCFDLDWIGLKMLVKDYRLSDLVIDLTDNRKFEATVRKNKAIYKAVSFTELNLKDKKFKKEIELLVNELYKSSSIIKRSPLPALYHISFSSKLPHLLKPRQPDGTDELVEAEENNTLTAENLPDRVSFSSSIEGCFRAIYPNILDIVKEARGRAMLFNVYMLNPVTKKSMYKDPQDLTEQKKVHDACFTMEYTFFKTVSVKLIAEIAVIVSLNPRDDMITYQMFGGPVVGGDTGWAPDITYGVTKAHTPGFINISKYDLDLRRQR